jgi:hypothetical protein
MFVLRISRAWLNDILKNILQNLVKILLIVKSLPAGKAG